MTSAITTYRSDVIAALTAKFMPNTGLRVLRTVEKHSGKFDEKELMRIVSTAPAAYVAVLNVPQKGEFATGQGNFEINLGVFVFTTHENGRDADDIGWDIAEQIAAMALNNVFGSQVSVFPAKKVEIQNLWSRNLDDLNACIMAVGWCADVVLGDDLDAAAMQLLTDTVGSDVTLTVNDPPPTP